MPSLWPEMPPLLLLNSSWTSNHLQQRQRNYGNVSEAIGVQPTVKALALAMKAIRHIASNRSNKWIRTDIARPRSSLSQGSVSLLKDALLKDKLLY